MITNSNNAIIQNLHAKYGSAIQIGSGCDFATDLCIEIDDGGFLAIGDRVSIRRGTTIQVHRGATVIISQNVAIGENVFISAMVGIRIDEGVGVSNMVDLHDHNHRVRSPANIHDMARTPWESGFVGAPIILETGAIVSNKVSITAGVRIGQNSIIGANSVVTKSIAPNTMAVGSPARQIRTFDGPIVAVKDRHVLKFAWFGTSIMEHLEAYNARMMTQSNLPSVGSSVIVEEWRKQGYVQRLNLALRTSWPYLRFHSDNRGEGGATSRDVLRLVRDYFKPHDRVVDVTFISCGINDVWRGFQGRHAEAVDAGEFDKSYREILELVIAGSRRVVCLAETPFGWDIACDVNAMNAQLARYNAIAGRAASDAGAIFLDIWPAFTSAAQQFGVSSSATTSLDSLWSDGVHLSDLGDALMMQLIEQYLFDSQLIQEMACYEIYERSEALKVYSAMFAFARRGL